jgi:hypothetical protein
MAPALSILKIDWAANLNSWFSVHFTGGTMKHFKLAILGIAVALSATTSAHAQALDQSGASLIRPGDWFGDRGAIWHDG